MSAMSPLSRDEIMALMSQYIEYVSNHMETAATELLLPLDPSELRELCRRLAGNAVLMGGIAHTAVQNTTKARQELARLRQ